MEGQSIEVGGVSDTEMYPPKYVTLGVPFDEDGVPFIAEANGVPMWMIEAALERVLWDIRREYEIVWEMAPADEEED